MYRLVPVSLLLVVYMCDITSAAGGAGTEVRLHVSSPVNPVEENAILSFRCQVWNLKGHQSVEIRRISTTSGKPETIFVGEDLLPSSSDNVFVAVRQLNDGSTVYFLTIMYATRADEGEYFFKITRDVGADTENVKWGSQDIAVLYPPQQSDPICHQTEQRTAVQEGGVITLNCSSETANPPVSLTWQRVGSPSSAALAPYTNSYTSHGRTYAMLNLEASMVDDGAMFLCEVTSSSFPDDTRTCHIGPIVIISDTFPDGMPPGETDTDHLPPNNVQPSKENSLIPVTKTPFLDPSSKTEVCRRYCKSTNPSTTTPLFWVVATAIAASTALIFFLIFIICLLKVCKEGGRNGNNNHHPHSRLYIQRQPVEDIYSEVDVRKMPPLAPPNEEHHRINRDYMALQKQDCADMLGHNYIVTGEKRL